MLDPFTTAVAGLKAFGATVAGINDSYGSEVWAQQRIAVKLPCLVVMKSKQDSDWLTYSAEAQSPRVEFELEHWLLYQGWGQSADNTLTGPSLLTLFGNYITALKATPFFTNNTNPSTLVTHSAPETKYKFTPIKFGEPVYWGIVFRHRLEQNL